MSTSETLFAAVLAMDAYNRGTERGLILNSIARNSVGNAEHQPPLGFGGIQHGSLSGQDLKADAAPSQVLPLYPCPNAKT